MALVIDAPRIENRLNKAAAKKGVKPAELAVEILSDHLGPEGSAKRAAALPFYATASPDQWVAEFNRWIESHPERTPLAADAFDRATFYEGRA
jgi:hypothetical protein